MIYQEEFEVPKGYSEFINGQYTDNTMAKRRTDNTMAKRKSTK